MKIEECKFDRATVRAEDEPHPLGGDVVFLGRSNVGKSSLINVLLGAKGLARTSNTPGRTQTVNFYRVNRAHFFVDLPRVRLRQGAQEHPVAVGPDGRGVPRAPA